MNNGYPWKHEHIYQSIHTALEDRTFTASTCAKCEEHKVVSWLKKLFRIA